MKICIAEKNPNISQFLAREFAREGYEVRRVQDCFEAWWAVGSDAPPDLLVLDLELSCPDSMTLLSRILRHRPEIPVILHTFGADSVGPEVAGRVAAVVEKKPDPGRLMAMVREVVRLRLKKEVS